MPKHYCPMCGSRSIQVVATDSAVCMICQTSVVSLKSITLIQPRPAGTA